jgi:hypothetical protein
VCWVRHLQGAVPFQQHWNQDHTIRGVHSMWQVDTGPGSVSALIWCMHASIPCLSPTHKPLKGNNHVMGEECKWRRFSPGGLHGETERLPRGMASLSFMLHWQQPCGVHSVVCIPCTPCFHTSKKSLNHPDYCYDESMVCTIMG